MTPTTEQFLSVIASLPSFLRDTDADYDLAWDWVCFHCECEWLEGEQIQILDSVFDYFAA